MEHFLQENVPIRHLLNAKTQFMSWRRSAFNEENDWAPNFNGKSDITQNVNENMNTHNGHDANDDIPGNNGSRNKNHNNMNNCHSPW